MTAREIPALLEQSRVADVRSLRALNVPQAEIDALVGSALHRRRQDLRADGGRGA